MSDGKTTCAVEVKSKDRVRASDCRGLEYLMARDPSIDYGVVISLQGAPLKLAEKVYNFPVWNL